MLSERNPRTGVTQHICDVANVLKAFIGSNFLSIPFAFSRCGMLLGVVGMACIGVLTAHCCLLLVACKHRLVLRILAGRQHVRPHQQNASDIVRDQHVLTKVPDCGTRKAGMAVGHCHAVDSSLKRGLDPVHEKTDGLQNGDAACGGKSEPSSCGSHVTSSWCKEAKIFEDEEKRVSCEMYGALPSSQSSHRQLIKALQYGDVAKACLGRWGIVLVNAIIIITQLGFCINYIIFTSNALWSFFPVYNCTITQDCANFSLRATPDCANSDTWRRRQGQELHNGVSARELTLTYTVSRSQTATQSSVTPVDVNRTAAPLLMSLATEGAPACGQAWSQVWSSAPDLRLMVAGPTVVCMLLVLVRDLRRLGLVSAAGNLALLAGAVVVLGLLVARFRVSDSWAVSQVEGLPIFVSVTAGALEGIGTILPIEASMAGNRHNFPVFLMAGLALVVGVDVGVSVLAYLSFGGGTAQIVTLNLQAASLAGVAVNACLLVGVMLTFPLMAFPVLQLLEKALSNWGMFGGSEHKDIEQLHLLQEDQQATSKIFHSQSNKVSSWKRSLMRIILVLLVAGLAVLLRNNFAYVAAFTGAVGSITLAYTLPCIFHLQMCWPELSLAAKVKDTIIIVSGLLFTITSLYTAVLDLMTP